MAASYKKPIDRVPPNAKPAASHALKKAHRASESKLSLKVWARKQTDDVIVIQLADWLFNKTTNFANPNLCIGRTRLGKGSKGNVHRDMTGR